MHKKREKFATVRAARGSFSLRFTAHRSLRKSEIPGRGVSCLPNSRSRNRPVALATSESAQKHFFGLQSEELNRHAAFRGEFRRQPQYRVTEQGPTVRTTSLNLLYRPVLPATHANAFRAKAFAPQVAICTVTHNRLLLSTIALRFVHLASGGLVFTERYGRRRE